MLLNLTIHFFYHHRFQELDLSAEALVFNDSSREDSWLKAIENALPPTTHYYKVTFFSLMFLTYMRFFGRLILGLIII